MMINPCMYGRRVSKKNKRKGELSETDEEFDQTVDEDQTQKEPELGPQPARAPSCQTGSATGWHARPPARAYTGHRCPILSP